jgi:hypothetical protein
VAIIAAIETTGPPPVRPAAGVAHLEVGGVEPQIRPFAFDPAIEEGADAHVDVLAERRDLALRDAAHAHRLDQLVDLARRDALDPRLLDDRDERLLGRLARLQEAREVAAAAQLRDLQLERPEPGLEVALAITVAVRRPLVAALVAPGADQSLSIELHQPLQHRLGQLLQKIPAAALLQQLEKCHSLLGHRVHLQSSVERQQPNLTEEAR